jgi:NAD(P)-dependent dehydrogenase (short-subunit alcohol dehydrogenase family)
MELGLDGRACVVTGASGGIGSAIAQLLAAEGASLLLVGRRLNALEATAAACAEATERAGREGGVPVEILTADITLADAATAVIDACVAAFGRIEVLVNSAGATRQLSLEELTDAEWQAQWELNVIGPMRLMRSAAPLMGRRGWGRIVNVSSSTGKRPSALNMAYGVAKTAQLALSRSFADLFAAQGVLVNAVTPGPIAGEAWLGDGGFADQRAAAMGVSRDEALAAVAGGIPIGRMGTDDEVAAVVVFLCSELASNVAGAAWSVDGGSVRSII